MTPHHVTSLDWSKKLKEAGVPQKSEFYYTKNGIESINQLPSGRVRSYHVSAFLSDELAEMLPPIFNINDESYHCVIQRGLAGNLYYAIIRKLEKTEVSIKKFSDKFLPNALAAMVVYLKERKTI